MALTPSQKSSKLFKKSLGAGETLITRDFFEEPRLGSDNIFTTQIWSGANLIPTNAPSLSDGQITGVTQYFDKLSLIHVAGSNNLSYYHTNLKDCIPFNYGNGTYNYKLYKSDGITEIAFGEGDWLVDITAGILTFYGTLPSNISSVLPPRISFYRYIGNKGITSYEDIYLDSRLDNELLDRISGDTSLSTVISANLDQIDGDFLTRSGTSINLGGDSYNESVLDYMGYKTFDIGTGFNSNVFSIIEDSNGKIYVGGDFTTYQGLPQNRLIRLNSDGSKDTSFDIGTGFNSLIWVTKIDSNGKILVCGDFTTYKGLSQNKLIRLNSDGSKDTSFDIGTGFDGYNMSSLTIDSSGKIYVGGKFTTYQGLTTGNNLIRLNSDGTKDTSFDIGTGFDGYGINSIIIDSNGKIYAGGYYTTYKGLSQNRLIRLNSDGTKDTSFDIGTGFNSQVYSIIIDSIGKIYVGGVFTTYQGSPQNKSVKLNSDGSIDYSFDIGIGFSSDVRNILIDSNGKILITGLFNAYNGTTQTKLIRLNTNGTKDTSFNNIGPNKNIFSTFIDSRGKIYLGGDFTSYSGLTRNYLTKLDEFGNFDTSLNLITIAQIKINQSGLTYGANYSNYTNNLRWIPDKGYFSTSLSTEISTRLSVDTSLSTVISSNTLTFSDFLTKTGTTVNLGGDSYNESVLSFSGSTGLTQIKINQSGLTYGANYSGYTNNIRWIPDKGYVSTVLSTEISNRITGDTSLSTAIVNNTLTFSDFLTRTGQTVNLGGDSYNQSILDYMETFFIGTGFVGATQIIYDITLDSNGKIYVAGGYTSYNGSSQNYYIRLNSDGTKDTSFNIGTGFFKSDGVATYQSKLTSDNKIYIGGYFDTYNGLVSNYFIRLNYDGSKDNSFNLGTAFNNRVYGIQIDSNGKIYAGGGFSLVSGSTQNYLIRLNSGGTKDTAFDIGTGFGSWIYVIQLDLNGKLLVGGQFTTYKGLTQNRLIRLNTDGTKDSSFDIGTGFDWTVEIVVVDSSNKIYVGGQFTTYKDLPQNRLIRLDSGGTKDSSFDIGTGFNNIVKIVLIDSNGKIYVGGQFTTYKDLPQNRLIRLNSDGTKDSSFDIGTGFDSGIVNTIIIDSFNKILVGGSFSSYQGITSNRFIKLNIDGSICTYGNELSQIKINQSGLTYGANYSGYTNNLRWLPDKKFYDSTLSTELSTRLSTDISLSTAIVNINFPNVYQQFITPISTGQTINVIVTNSAFTYSSGTVDIDSVIITLNGIQYNFNYSGTTEFHTNNIIPTGVPIPLYFNGVVADFNLEYNDEIILKYTTMT